MRLPGHRDAGRPGDGLRTRNGTGIHGSLRSSRLSRAARVVPGGLLGCDYTILRTLGESRDFVRAHLTKKGMLKMPQGYNALCHFIDHAAIARWVAARIRAVGTSFKVWATTTSGRKLDIVCSVQPYGKLVR